MGGFGSRIKKMEMQAGIQKTEPMRFFVCFETAINGWRINDNIIHRTTGETDQDLKNRVLSFADMNHPDEGVLIIQC